MSSQRPWEMDRLISMKPKPKLATSTRSSSPLTANTGSGPTSLAGDEGGGGIDATGPTTGREASTTEPPERYARPLRMPIGTESSGKSSDDVNHPPHYTKGDVECFDAITAAAEGWPAWAAPALGNVIKYTWRCFQKGKALRDIDKAIWYLNRARSDLLKKGYRDE